MIRPGLLVSVDEVPSHAVLLDTRLTTGGAPGPERYAAGHLPGAAYVDLDEELADPVGDGSLGRHPLPSRERFVAAMRRAGVRRDSTVVVYDDGPATAAARLWWLLRDHGHEDVMVLDGGLAAWQEHGREVSTEDVHPQPGDWDGEPGHLATVDEDGVREAAGRGDLVDVRAPERFRGESEPIDPVAGHVPGAVNRPLSGNTGGDQRFLDAELLARRFEGLGDVVAYCGSGVTAAQTVLALALTGRDAALYPGSWSGWIADPERAVATGDTPGAG